MLFQRQHAEPREVPYKFKWEIWTSIPGGVLRFLIFVLDFWGNRLFYRPRL